MYLKSFLMFLNKQILQSKTDFLNINVLKSIDSKQMYLKEMYLNKWIFQYEIDVLKHDLLKVNVSKQIDIKV